uniref:Uncharacterized protein MANES_04G067000 n=1 Tax=Rhizophora mucronata TaxID=61149 RepID=A0A2P2LHM8_RHIMU
MILQPSTRATCGSTFTYATKWAIQDRQLTTYKLLGTMCKRREGGEHGEDNNFNKQMVIKKCECAKSGL